MRRWGLAAGSRSLGLYFTLLVPGYHEVSSACHIHAPAEPAETSEAKGASLLRSVCHIAHSRVKRAALNIRTFSPSPLAYPPLLLSSDEEWFGVLRVSVGAADALGPCQMEEGLRTEPGRAGLSQLSGGWWWDSEKAWLWEHAHDAWWINQPWPLLGRADSQGSFPKPGIWKSGIFLSPPFLLFLVVQEWNPRWMPGQCSATELCPQPQGAPFFSFESSGKAPLPHTPMLVL